jgi:cytochrome c
MSGSRLGFVIGLALVLWSLATAPSRAQSQNASQRYGFGVRPTTEELSRFFAVAPDGRGLPAGRGTYAQGREIYAHQCVVCHGESLEGWGGGMPMPPEMAAMGDGRLIGGRGTLGSPSPVMTVESYWPYATTLWDYTKRAMPLHAPGSLTDDEVYALVAFILGEANIVPRTAVIDAMSLPRIVMPNRDGFVQDPRPEPELMR